MHEGLAPTQETEPERNVNHLVLVPVHAELENGNITQLLASGAEQHVPLHFIFYVNDLKTDDPRIKAENMRTAQALSLVQKRDTDGLVAMKNQARSQHEAEALEGLIPLCSKPNLSLQYFQVHNIPSFDYGLLQAALIERALAAIPSADRDSYTLHLCDADVTFSSRFFMNMHHAFADPTVQSAFAGYETYPDAITGLEYKDTEKLRLINYDADRLEWAQSHARLLHHGKIATQAQPSINSETSQIAVMASAISDEMLQTLRRKTFSADYALGEFLLNNTSTSFIFTEAWVNASMRAQPSSYGTNSWVNYSRWRDHEARIKEFGGKEQSKINNLDKILSLPVDMWSIPLGAIPPELIAQLPAVEYPREPGFMLSEDAYRAFGDSLEAVLGIDGTHTATKYAGELAYRIARLGAFISPQVDIGQFLAIKQIVHDLPEHSIYDYFEWDAIVALKSSIECDGTGFASINPEFYGQNMRLLIERCKLARQEVLQDFSRSPFYNGLLTDKTRSNYLRVVSDKQQFDHYIKLYERRVGMEKSQRKQTLRNFITMKREHIPIPAKPYRLFEETFSEEVSVIEDMITAGIETEIIQSYFTNDSKYKHFFNFTAYDRDFVFYSAWQQAILEQT